MTDTCGDYGGTTAADEPCGRPAGWGTDLQTGECREHAEAFTQPRKLTTEVEQSILGAAQRGAFKKHCAQVAGLPPRTLRRWLAEGEEHVENGLETPLADFYVRFQRARGAGAAAKLSDASPEFILERSYGYTKTQEVEHSGSAIPIFTEAPDDEVLRQALDGDGE